MENEIETLDSSTEEIETNDSINVEPEPEPEPEKEIFTEREKQYFNRIKKLEAELEQNKAHKPEVRTINNVGLSAGDLMAIKNADIEEKDMDLVEKFAHDNKLPLREALHHPHMKAILSYEKEVRTTSVATNVENVRRGSVKVSDESLVNNAMNGKLPTTDDEIEQLIHAKFKRR